MKSHKEKIAPLSLNPSFMEPADEFTPLYRDMLKFARLVLRDDDLAQDAVQETLVSAISNRSQFDHKSELKTWVFRILKNKINDLFRIKK